MSRPSNTPVKHERDDNPPFLVRVFHRSGTFHHPDEFTAHSLPPHARIYTWPTTTLNELALQLADAIPGALPSPAIGTRLDFRLVYPDIRQSASSASAYHASHQPQPRYLLKGLGSVVLGEGQQAGSVARNGDTSDDHPEDEDLDEDAAMRDAAAALNPEGERTLSEAKFVIGDYISCAILPPLSDGSVAPPIAELPPGRTPRGGPGRGGGGGGGGPGGPPQRDQYRGRENGTGRGPSWGGGRRDGGGGGLGRGFDRLPSGEWRRGERLPDPPPSRPRNRHGRY